MSYAEKLKKLADERAPKIETDKAARLARDEAELEAVVKAVDEVGGTFETDGDSILSEHVLRVPKAPPAQPGHVVVRPPTRQEVARFRAMLTKPAGERGAKDARANASTDLGNSCVVYPEHDKYQALLDACPGVDLEVATMVHELARAGAEAEIKK